MKLQLLTISLVALAGALITPTAHAQYVASNEDLILSFQDTADSDPNDLQIDIGNISAFTGTPSFTSLNLSADLVAQFGSNWYSNSNLVFSIAGANTLSTTVNGYAGHSIFVSDPTTSTFAALSSANLGTPESRIGELSSNYGANASPGHTANSDVLSTGTTNSYSHANPNGNFNSLFSADSSTVETTFGQGTDPQLYLDILTPNTSSLVTDSSGNPYFFDINSSGVLTFTTGVAAPEPSTYALMFLGVGALVVLVRRKSVSNI